METLQKLLKGNGAFSAANGAVLLFGALWLDGAFGLHAWLLAIVGLGLIGYGILLARLANPEHAISGGKFATAMDFAWVVGAAVILLAFPTAMTTVGRVILLAMTVVVAALATEQTMALRRLDA